MVCRLLDVEQLHYLFRDLGGQRDALAELWRFTLV
jgi:hypothetical protein